MKKTFIALASALVLATLLAGCGNQQSSQKTSSSSANKTSKATNYQQAQNQIVGSFKDDQDGAAITLNSDGTGQYVYADTGEPDTNDQLTWKKDGDSYTINLKDSNVTSALTGKLSGNRLTLSGDSNWNTETLTKTKGKLNLNQFLSEEHQTGKKDNNSSNSNQGNQNNQASQSSQNNQGSQSNQGNTTSQSGNTKDYTDSQGGHHHVVMANNPGPNDPKGTDYVTDSDGHTHVFEYDGN